MNNRMKEVLMCPVCIDMLRVPVLVLPCQHNLCKPCVAVLHGSEIKNSCPICRKEFQIESVDELPRNFIVEQLIEEHIKHNDNDTQATSTQRQGGGESSDIPSKDLVVTFSKVEVSPSAPSAPPDQTTTNSQKPVRPPPPINTTAVVSEQKSAALLQRQKEEMDDKMAKAFKNIQIQIETINTLIISEQFEAAGRRADELAAAAVSLPLTELHCEAAVRDLRDLAKLINSRDEPNAAISLLFASAKLCERVPEAEAKIAELMYCAEAMQPVARKAYELSMVTQFKQHAVPVLADVVRRISHVANADRTSKLLKEAWCLRHVAMCCSYVGDYEEAVVHNREAIELLTRGLGRAVAAKRRIYGVCQHNLAAAHKQLGSFAEAEKAYLAAIEAYNRAEDWPDAERKRRSVLLSSTGLTEVGRLLQ